MMLHCSTNNFLRFLIPGWYVVAKRKVLSFVFFFRVRADGLESKLTSSRHLSTIVLG